MPRLVSMDEAAPEPTKQCYACKQIKSLARFPTVKKKDGTARPYAYCYDCDNQKQRDCHKLKRGDKFRQPTPKSDTEKWCPACKSFKPVEMFASNHKARSGLSGNCKDCTKPAVRRHYLKRRYGLDEGDYEAMLLKQGHVCAICLQPETVVHMGKVPNLSVDHCHSTMAVRGLLCYSCNHLVGFIERLGADRIEAAITYLGSQGNEGGQ